MLLTSKSSKYRIFPSLLLILLSTESFGRFQLKRLISLVLTIIKFKTFNYVLLDFSQKLSLDLLLSLFIMQLQSSVETLFFQETRFILIVAMWMIHLLKLRFLGNSTLQQGQDT